MILEDPPLSSSSMKIQYIPLSDFNSVQCVKLQYQDTFPFIPPDFRISEKSYYMNYYYFENNLQTRLDLQRIMTCLKFKKKYNSEEYAFVSRNINHKKNKKFCHAVIQENLQINQLNPRQSGWMKRYNRYYPKHKQHYAYMNYNILSYENFYISGINKGRRPNFKHVFLNTETYKSWNIQITCSMTFQNWEILIYKKIKNDKNKPEVAKEKINELNKLLFEYFRNVF